MQHRRGRCWGGFQNAAKTVWHLGKILNTAQHSPEGNLNDMMEKQGFRIIRPGLDLICASCFTVVPLVAHSYNAEGEVSNSDQTATGHHSSSLSAPAAITPAKANISIAYGFHPPIPWLRRKRWTGKVGIVRFAVGASVPDNLFPLIRESTVGC
ncbi:hypothetical protein K438DRAFT_1776149 [Mycena galopus ATCC 62051]|nr:hypothetical protein K438DRAFT_1776149 [Mycena galopus ATCC 62051]